MKSKRYLLPSIIFLFLLFVIPLSSAIWVIDDSIETGAIVYPDVFQMNDTWYMIGGYVANDLGGWVWTGTYWVANGSIINGLVRIGQEHQFPTVFEKDGIFYLICGGLSGNFDGWNWTGTAWQIDNAIVSGLSDIGGSSTPKVFEKDGTWYLIAGESNGNFNGWNWTGSTWTYDATIISGLGSYSGNFPPILDVFEMNNEWYLINGENYGNFYGHNWSGSTWQNDSAITNGLVSDVGYRSSPTVYQKNLTLFLLSGSSDGTSFGHNQSIPIYVSCGNLICEFGEDYINCPSDCPAPPPVEPPQLPNTTKSSVSGSMTLPTQLVDVANIHQGLLPEIYYGTLGFMSSILRPTIILVFLIFFVMIMITMGVIVRKIFKRVSELSR